MIDDGPCPTCHGDRYVLYSIRAVEQTMWMKERGIEPAHDEGFEEYAPCPDCNGHTDNIRKRYDGSVFRPPDPGAVRDRISR